jgi:general secretion pathway protein G
VLILASAIMPLAKVTSQRSREAELRAALREIRTAIDKYKGRRRSRPDRSVDIKVGSENYPPDLQTLVDGVTCGQRCDGTETEIPASYSGRIR